ncbi:MAG: PmoA family protein [Candidatus Hydrogenedentota bacterium]
MKTKWGGSLVLVCMIALLCAIAAGADMCIVYYDTHLSLRIGGKELAEYRFAKVPYKPYMSVFRTPSGIDILRDAPHDHLHHHALMFAIGVDGVDFWQEGNAPGRQVHREFSDTGDLTPRYESTGFIEQLDWLGPESERPLIQEKRTIHVFDPEEFGASLISWEAELTVPEEKETATLTGSHYFGLGMRFVESMDKEGTFFNADEAEGEPVRGDERLTRSRWCAYTSTADGKPVTAAMFDSPDNPRYPAWWFTMKTPFAYLSATQNLHREPMEVKAGAPLTLRYGVALWDGHVDPDTIEQLYKEWLATQETIKKD